MVEIPERAILIRKPAIANLRKSADELAEILTFNAPFCTSEHVVIYGPYFDFESLEEVGKRLRDNGLEFWDDYIDFKEDFPTWLRLSIIDESST